MAAGPPDGAPLPTPTGLKLQGATCSNNKLSLSNAISTALPLTQLRWAKQTNAEKKANVVGGTSLAFVGRETRRVCVCDREKGGLYLYLESPTSQEQPLPPSPAWFPLGLGPHSQWPPSAIPPALPSTSSKASLHLPCR